MVHVVAKRGASKGCLVVEQQVQQTMVLCPGRDSGNLYQGRQSLFALGLRDVERGKREKSCDFLSTYGRSE